MTAPWVVLIADQIAEEGLAPLAGDPRFTLVRRPVITPGELAEAIGACDAVLVRSATKVTRASLVHGERLRCIGRAGVGVDTIDVAAASEQGIAVLTAPAGNSISAAELTMGLLLSLARKLPAADRSMRAGEWERKAFMGFELHGKTLGLVGAGRIGGQVAKRARAFGMRVLVYDPWLTAARAHELDVELASLDAVLTTAHVLSVHVPLTEETTGLIGTAELARTRPGAVLLNVARGGVVDEAALLAALQQGQLAGAALDVYAREPLPADHPFRSLPNVVLTPHLGASTNEAQLNVAVEICEAVRNFLTTGDTSNAVNTEHVRRAPRTP